MGFVDECLVVAFSAMFTTYVRRGDDASGVYNGRGFQIFSKAIGIALNDRICGRVEIFFLGGFMGYFTINSTFFCRARV